MKVPVVTWKTTAKYKYFTNINLNLTLTTQVCYGLSMSHE